jgi:hypothetical protein
MQPYSFGANSNSSDLLSNSLRYFSLTMSNGGSVYLHGLTILENPRRSTELKRSRTIIFDAHLYLPGSESLDGNLALLRYYNDSEMAFGAIGSYFITANVSGCIGFYSLFSCNKFVFR